MRKSFVASKEQMAKDSAKLGEIKQERERKYGAKMRTGFRRSKSRSRDVKEVAKPSYYMKSLQYYLGLTQMNEFAKIYREHFAQSVSAFRFIGSIRMPSDEMMATCKVQCARLEASLKSSKG